MREIPSNSNGRSRDKAGLAYWESLWLGSEIATPVDPHQPGLNNYVNRELHQVFKRVLGTRTSPGKSLIELGCATSGWLPYFAREFGFRVSGIDYSETGCRNAKITLGRAGVEGQIYCADIFSPPSGLIGVFDVVFSFGVAEHFADTTSCIRAFSAFMAPRGLIVTLIPNMRALPGFLQRIADRRVYDIHVPLDARGLASAHEEAGLDVIESRYLLPINLNVVNVERRKGTWFYRPFIRARSWISKGMWMIQAHVPLIPENRVTSPYILCVAQKAL